MKDISRLTEVKHHGKVFTPDYLVKIILDIGHYSGGSILRRHVIDNSCGDGQFLIQVVNRYCNEFLRESKNLEKLKIELETFIHGIEIEKDELDLCKNRCDVVARLYGVEKVKWDFYNQNTLSVKKFDGKMDYVVGNPPYVRIHNLSSENFDIKKSIFCQNGMTDLYIAFFEIGVRMLNDSGVLAYITPSSYFTSVAGAEMRSYYVKNQMLESICDLKHFQPFKATTYTAITCLNKGWKKDIIAYSEFNEKEMSPSLCCNLTSNDYYINGQYYFSTKESLQDLRSVLRSNKKTSVFVKNGYATLADSIFIKDFSFKSHYIIPVIKASCQKWTNAIFPYDENGQLIEKDVLFRDENLKKYLEDNKNKLCNRSIEKSSKYWYAYGRSQGIKDTWKRKIAIGALVKKGKGLKIADVPPGSGVYSGLYITSETISYSIIKKILRSDDFYNYVSLLGKYKSGGYYTFSSKDVANFLNYKINEGELDAN